MITNTTSQKHMSEKYQKNFQENQSYVRRYQSKDTYCILYTKSRKIFLPKVFNKSDASKLLSLQVYVSR